MKSLKKLFVASLLTTVLAYAVPSKKIEFKKPVNHAAMHFIYIANETEGGWCTATAIAPHVLLTAEHCDSPNGELTVDSETTTQPITKRIKDNQDHLLLVIPNENFKNYITYDPTTYKVAKQTEHVYFWGNPQGSRDQYREGYMMGTVDTPDFDDDKPIHGTAYVFQMTDAPGDSGAAVYAEDGRLVTVVTGGNGVTTIGFALKFTAQQVEDAKK